MKIATFNVNGIKSRLPGLLAWLEREIEGLPVGTRPAALQFAMMDGRSLRRTAGRPCRRPGCPGARHRHLRRVWDMPGNVALVA
jgi:hypothetical protein